MQRERLRRIESELSVCWRMKTGTAVPCPYGLVASFWSRGLRSIPEMNLDALVRRRRVRRGVVGKPQVSRLHNIGGAWASQGW
jgi:hypothetical protein